MEYITMDKFKLRQNILRELVDLSPGVARTEEITRGLRLFGLSQDQKQNLTLTELNALSTYGFVENARQNANREPLWTITATGMAQITNESDTLDPRIWDDLAYIK